MVKSKLAGLVVIGLLAGAGAVHAAEQTFPTMGMESGDLQLSTKNAREGVAVINGSAFPSAAQEGYEFGVQSYRQPAPRGLDRMITSTRTSVFPTSAME